VQVVIHKAQAPQPSISIERLNGKKFANIVKFKNAHFAP
jgi:hypothetical protein